MIICSYFSLHFSMLEYCTYLRWGEDEADDTATERHQMVNSKCTAPRHVQVREV